MSLYVQTRNLVNPSVWPPIREHFQSSLDGNEVEPAWLMQCKTQKTIQILGPDWLVFSEFILEKLPEAHAMKCAEHLWIINADNATAIANKMSPLHQRIYREIEKRCRDQSSWPTETVITSTIALRDHVQSWLSALSKNSWGVLRLYDWGKY